MAVFRSKRVGCIGCKNSNDGEPRKWWSQVGRAHKGSALTLTVSMEWMEWMVWIDVRERKEERRQKTSLVSNGVVSAQDSFRYEPKNEPPIKNFNDIQPGIECWLRVLLMSLCCRLIFLRRWLTFLGFGCSAAVVPGSEQRPGLYRARLHVHNRGMDFLYTAIDVFLDFIQPEQLVPPGTLVSLTAAVGSSPPTRWCLHETDHFFDLDCWAFHWARRGSNDPHWGRDPPIGKDCPPTDWRSPRIFFSFP